MSATEPSILNEVANTAVEMSSLEGQKVSPQTSPTNSGGKADVLSTTTNSNVLPPETDLEALKPITVIDETDEVGGNDEKAGAEKRDVGLAKSDSGPTTPPPGGVPPDGGLEAWLTVVGSFIMHFIVIGSVYT